LLVEVIQLKMLSTFRSELLVEHTMALNLRPTFYLQLNYFTSILVEHVQRFQPLGPRDLSTVESCKLGKSDNGEVSITGIIWKDLCLAAR
jgi:hypothetical protein